ncbi:MAG: YeeE/YedE family protein [Myxococcota bacterium]|jgi:hypothetical protein|nr:YeeE/YedE family protein [Myxococcota bacterium]
MVAPFQLSSLVGSLPYYGIFFLIGAAFGAVLEVAGFGDSRKLAAQFYLREMTVLKVMFTAIVVACVLLFGAAGLGLLDMDRVWVNPTFLAPQIVGGLIMGLGFIIGGFCPGTSVVAASTFKLDGVAFLGGVGLGVWAFGETVHLFDGFYNSTSMGRFMLSELFGLPTGVVVTMVVAMALFMFYAGEIAEAIFGAGRSWGKDVLRPRGWRKGAAAGALATAAVAVALIGQPDAQERWAALAKTAGVELQNRDPYVHPGEVVEWKRDGSMAVEIWDVRSTSDFNKFHLLGAQRLEPDRLSEPSYLRHLQGSGEEVLRFVVSNGETDATAAWKVLRGVGIGNLYIIEGGINEWLRVYPPDPCIATALPDAPRRNDEQLAFAFHMAVGSSCYAAHPDMRLKEPAVDCEEAARPTTTAKVDGPAIRPVPFDEHAKPSFVSKVKIVRKTKVKGGCG